MLVTEDQARELWCPETRHIADDGPASNRWGMAGNSDKLRDNPPECRCIASKCMFWRWGERFIDSAGNLMEAGAHHVGEAQESGYCGKASKP